MQTLMSSLFFLEPVMKSEAAYQATLIGKLKDLFPGCFVVKNDPQRRQGLPDLLILFKDKWAMLEVKRSESAPARPNQNHYVESFAGMSFASFIFPENEEQVLNDLQSALRPKRKARIPKS